MRVRVQVFEVTDRDHLVGTSAKGAAYDFWLQYGLLDQAPARPVQLVVGRERERAKCLPAGLYEADLVLEDRRGKVEPVLGGFKPVAAVAASARVAG